MITSKQPIIIIGMHRSGTTMLSKVLEKAGLYQGWKKEENNESIFFIKLNEWMLRELGGRWDEPESLVNLSCHSQEHIDAIVNYIRSQLAFPRALEYLGMKCVLSPSLFNIHIPWCWKDPRTTLLMDIWLRIFPNAKVVHILRHGVDVAQSLKVRSSNSLSKSILIYQKRHWIYSLRGMQGLFTDSARCLSLEGGFSIWEAYVKAARRCHDLASGGFFEFRYEDLLENPEEVLEALFLFCGLKFEKSSIQHYSGSFDKSKSRHYLNSHELVRFSEEVATRLNSFGY